MNNHTNNTTTNNISNKSCILVTGGAGYIGSHAVIELLAQDYEVVVVDNLCNSSIECIRRVEKIAKKEVIFYEMDILDEPKLSEIFKKHHFEAVMHFAGLKAVGESCDIPLKYYHNNLSGSISLLQVMNDHNVTNIIFSSSATVYGYPQKLPISESAPSGACTNPYGMTKHMTEVIIKDHCAANKNWKAVLLRYFNPMGAHKSGLIGEDPLGIPNNLSPFIAQVAVGRRTELKVFGSDYDTPDGTGVRDYIHVVDLALGHIAALHLLTTAAPSCHVFNLGTGVGYSVLEMVKAFEKVSGVKIAYSLVSRREGDVASVYADPSFALKQLGWKAERGLDEMCEDLWRWQKNNPHGFNAHSS